MPQATFASELKIDEEKAIVTREIDGGLQTISISLPAVVTTDLRLNEPRYASLPNIMQAKKKELSIQNVSDLGIDVTSRTTILSVELPPTREAGVMVDSVEELVEKLKNEAKVIT
jgi:electron transfer flavoprotein beta subunit